MPARKPTLPQYPRPVSPVSAEDIPICDETIVYYDPANDAPGDGEQRAAKRRRIESHATAYLRGQPIFIMTAQLRGPFDSGWKNPWAEKTIDKAKEAVASQQRLTSLARVTKPAHGKKQDPSASKADYSPRTFAETSKPATEKTKNKPAEGGRSPGRKSKQGENGVGQHLQENDLPTENNRIEDWLKRNAAYRRPENNEQSLPPPSPSEGKARRRENPRPSLNLPVPTDGIVRIAGHKGLLSSSTSALRRSVDFKSNLSSPLNATTPQHRPRARNCNTSPRQKYPETQHPAVEQADVSEFRAEYAILKSKQRTEHTASSVTKPFTRHAGAQDGSHGIIDSGGLEPSLGLPPPTNTTEERLKSAGDVISRINSTAGTVPDAHDTSPASPFEPGPRSLARERTKSSISTDLPSAQVPPLPVFASLPSNLSSHSQAPQEVLDHRSPRAIGTEDLGNAAVAEISAAEGTNSGADAGLDAESISATERQKPVPDDHQQSPMEVDELETSRLLTDRVSDVPLSTKRDGRGKQTPSSPGITKPGPPKSRRRLAFATDGTPSGSSRGTIKSALKVAKPTVMIQDTMAFNKTASPHGEEHCPATNDSSSPKFLRASAPKSILKASLQSSTIAPVHSNISSSSSNKQDAQRQQLLALVENDDNFDLDAAIDELGSFLSSWAAEREAFLSAPTTTARG
ncbi:hypothetical protein Z517_01823 [Fonsecaea pedrosoi CBS 271.37]|uniref:Uncharacterized protein n=1 Tax=Fonsecaea pedrosoi CBS 271.37 TaxID=1442368 RepID=A0A0D2FIC9_9EURO|nr:uncharacterized protein Z517_01823 [Fonsecaea pedrosoi CBS 271.37]KIW86427.1 hypothetical protein Z517_01823 [Fonsecaea pedrosoi CBS 271.37]